MQPYQQISTSTELERTIAIAESIPLTIDKVRTYPTVVSARTETRASVTTPQHMREFVSLYEMESATDGFAAIAMRGYEDFDVTEANDSLSILTTLKSAENVAMVPLTRKETTELQTAATGATDRGIIDGTRYAQTGDHESAKDTFKRVFDREMDKVPPQASTAFALYDDSPRTPRHDFVKLVHAYAVLAIIRARRAAMQKEAEESTNHRLTLARQTA